MAAVDSRRRRHVELHVAERLGARALEAALEAAQRVLEPALEELLRREAELGQRLEEHAAELLRVVLSEGVRLAPAKRGSERARRQRVPRAQLKLGKEPRHLLLQEAAPLLLLHELAERDCAVGVALLVTAGASGGATLPSTMLGDGLIGCSAIAYSMHVVRLSYHAPRLPAVPLARAKEASRLVYSTATLAAGRGRGSPFPPQGIAAIGAGAHTPQLLCKPAEVRQCR